MAKLRATNHNVYPVVQQRDDGSNYVVGTLLRQHLLLLLQTRKCLQPAPYIAEVSSRVAFSYSTPDFSKPISSAPLTLDDLKLSDEHYDLYLDLGPYANPTYHVVQEDTSLAKVYTLFRTLGLRHVAVVPRSSQIVGIISRKDLLPHVLESKFDDGYEQQQDGGARADGLPGGLMAGNGGSLGHHAAPGGLDHHAAGGGGGGMLTPTAGQRRSDPRF